MLRWPLGEALLAYEQQLKADAQHDYELRMLLWAALNSSGMSKRKKAPELPAILKES